MTSYRPAPRPAPRPRAPRWTRLVQRYGWRAYAVPILSVITVAALVHDTSATGTTHSTTRAAGAAGTHTNGVPTPHVQAEGLNAQSRQFATGATPAPVLVGSTDDGTSCATNSYDQLVLVSISKQHMWVCAQHRQIDSSPVTTGKTVDNDQTPLGSWRVQAKQRDRYLVGPGYRDYVHYWMPFNGDFGLHDAPWQTMPYGSKDYTVDGSHGCVHVPRDTMARLYGWASAGNTVVTIES